MASTVEQVKDKLSIQDVVSEYVKLERAGSSLKGRCPFHNEKTPSFFVSPERGTYHCFGCDVGGDIFTFVQEIEGIDFKGALKILADKAGVPIVYEKSETKDARDKLYTIIETATLFFIRNLTDTHPGRKYLKDRGINNETIKSFRIGFAPDDWRQLTEYLQSKGYTDSEIEAAGLAKKGDKGLYDRFRSRIMFPIMDSAGRVVAFSGRNFDSTTSDVARRATSDVVQTDVVQTPKYINSPETLLFRKSRILYGYDRAKQHIRKLNFSILVEGQMDLIASHQAGWENTVAVSGTALTVEHVVLLKRMSDNVLVALDADVAGVAAATKSARIALSSGMEVKVAELPEGMDPSDIIEKKGKEEWKKAIRESKHIITFLLDTLEKSSKDARSFQKSVEKAVLPFVQSTENPIDKEKFKHAIAERLGVSEIAIDEALASMPAQDGASVPITQAAGRIKKETQESKTTLHPRVRQLWGVILWQKDLEKPGIDVREVEKRLFGIVGKETAFVINDLSADQSEKLKFAAESIYAEGNSVSRAVDEVMAIIEEDTIRQRLSQTTAEIRRAEANADHEKETELKDRHRIYTDRLAQLRKKV